MTKYVLPEDKYISVNGVQTRYWEAGSRGGPVLVLIHGLGGYIENWFFNFAPMSQQFRVYALDMFGFGRTDKPDNKRLYVYREFARFLHSFMQELRISEASLCGHSLGGGIALQFSLLFPEMVNKLVLIGSGGLGHRAYWGLHLATLPAVGKIVTKPSLEGCRKALKNMVYDISQIDEYWIELAYEIASLPGAQRSQLYTLQMGMHLLGSRKAVIGPILTNLSKIRADTLLVWGRQDKIIDFRYGVRAERRIPKARLLAIDKCGHGPHWEYIDKFNQAAIAFLKG
jgi:4,5:9,10-diseco-3-hydroxy-5,9,17-trioxoandrosta-1(10),2-diene-4-oate hydrolase